MDNMSSPQFYQCKYGRIRLLTTDNYSEWSTTLTNFLRADRTWKIVQGLETVPTPPEPRPGRSRRNASDDENLENDLQQQYLEKLEDYESRAAKACSMIISSVSPSLQQFILTLTSPAEMWTTLKSQLDSTKANSGPFILRNQLYQEKYTS